jgi:hypothetical protein
MQRGIGSGSSPGGLNWSGNWEPVWDAKIDRIEINKGARPSIAAIWFPTLRWHENPPITWGDMVRIKTEENTVVFVGYVVVLGGEASGGSEKPGTAFERNMVICYDQRWAVAACSIIFGQLARTRDMYTLNEEGQPVSGVIDNPGGFGDERGYVMLSGHRAIFNPNGRPNLDSFLLSSEVYSDMPIFCNPGSSVAVPWTARDMMCYILHPSWTKVSRYIPFDNPYQLVGLEYKDKDEDEKNWGMVLNHICIEGLNSIEAVELICKHINWDFRLDYVSDGTTLIVFYKPGIREKTIRSGVSVIAQELHAPAVGEDIGETVYEGRKMLWALSFEADISRVVNNPFCLGAPHRYEVTVELVPGWKDYYCDGNLADLDNLFKHDFDLQKLDDPDLLPYYTAYHVRGKGYNAYEDLRNVFRKWVLNDTGVYTDPEPEEGGDGKHYNRGSAFEWFDVIPNAGAFAPYDRHFLPCLTTDSEGKNSVGIKLEFSFDGGTTWQVIPCTVRLLQNECGIFIDEPNIADIVDKKEGEITIMVGDDEFGPLELNLYTSLMDDRKSTHDVMTGSELGRNRSFKDKEWGTRVRITASVQMDQRTVAALSPSSSSGSPFDQAQIYDFSDKYGIAKRTDSSIFKTSVFPAIEYDGNADAIKHVTAIRGNNESMSISGRFTLDRMWLGDGQGYPDFMIGDSVSIITGRNVNFEMFSFEGGKASPEIIQIVYLPESQKQVLITRDRRFSIIDRA